MITKEIVGVENLPHVNKFRVHLECGHSILYDHTVDAVGEYFPLLQQNRKLICSNCEEEK